MIKTEYVIKAANLVWLIWLFLIFILLNFRKQ